LDGNPPEEEDLGDLNGNGKAILKIELKSNTL
jgi:hypothetical protein